MQATDISHLVDLSQGPLVNYLLIFFVVMVALAPLTHFLPSKHQRKQVALREYAALSGLFVEFRSLPGRVAGDRSAPDNVIYYGLRLRPSRQRLVRRQAWLQSHGHWQSVGKPAPLPEPLAACPDTVLASSLEEGSCGIYWQEQGDEGTVAEICRMLRAWAEQIQD